MVLMVSLGLTPKMASQQSLTIPSCSRRLVKMEVGERQSLRIYCALTYNALLMAHILFFKSSFKCQLLEVFQGLVLYVGMYLAVSV